MTNQDVITREQDRNMPVGNSLSGDLKGLESQFKFALPAHIPVERFMRVVITAVQREPKLRKCTKQSFFNACMQAANDGLLPDGREGAIVPFGEDEGGRKSDIATWMPMIYGIRKKVRNAGVLTDWNVQVVQEGDKFDYELGDQPFIKHKPSPTGGRTRAVLFAYSIATYPDGTLSREVMNIDQIKDIQSLAKAKKGPWSNPIHFPEMCRKTVAKLHAKQLPMSTDLDRLLHRDDALYDFAGAAERAKPQALRRPTSVAAALDSFGVGGGDDVPQPEEDKPAEPAKQPEKPAEPEKPASDPPAETPEQTAWKRGAAARASGMQRRAVPGEYREAGRVAECTAWEAGFDGKALPFV